jgi:hypothetical protein
MRCVNKWFGRAKAKAHCKKEKILFLKIRPSLLCVRMENMSIRSPLPQNLRMHVTQNGPRQNGVLEGMSFADDFKTLYVNLEEPRFEDGPRADVEENDAWVRFYKFDVATKKNTAQYAYKLDPVAYPSSPVDAFKVNGIPDILSVGDGKFIVLERSFSTGRLPCTIKIFLADAQRRGRYKK